MVNIIGEDLANNSGLYINVTFTVGSTNTSFNITTTEDNILEGDQKINISINSITNGHSVGTPGIAAVIIIDTTGQFSKQLCYTIIYKYAYFFNS